MNCPPLSCNYRSFPQVGIDQNELLLMTIMNTLKMVSLFIYIWLPWVFTAALGLALVARGGGYPLVAVGRLLIAVASLMEGHRL